MYFSLFGQAIHSVRKVQKDEWADEVNKGFDYNISMFIELEYECTKRQLTAT